MEDSDSRIAALTARVWRLEQALRRHGIAFDDTAAVAEPQASITPQPRTPAPPVTPAAPPPVSTPPPLAPHQSPSPWPPVEGPPRRSAPLFAAVTSEQPSAETPSLESRIASQWFNRIGILAVLIAAAWFLKLAFDNHWIGPVGRILIGVVTGAALVVWSERFRARGFPAFSYSLKAVGTGVLYLSLWASFAIYHLLPGAAAFAGMIAITASNATMAWLQDAELLAGYSIAGALATPALLSTGENHEITLFTYMLLLDLATLVLVMLKPWSRLLAAAFFGTVVYFFGWYVQFYAAQQLFPTTVYLVLFFLLFAVAPRLALDHPERDSTRVLWDQLVTTAMPAANAFLGFLACYGAFYDAGYHGCGPWLAVLFAAFYLLMVNLPTSGRLRESPPLLSALHLVASVAFLTIAVPLKAHGRWLTIGWLAEATALFWIETRVRSRLLEVLSLICLALGLIATIAQNQLDAPTPVFNPRFGCYLAAIASLALIAWLARRPAEETSTPAIDRQSLVATCILAINVLILLSVGWEIDTFWWVRRWHGDQPMLRAFEMDSQLTYSAFFMIFGAILLTIGFIRRSAFLRWQALILLAVTIAKVFLSDMSTLSQGYRIVSFLGLGALLLAVSYVYQRDVLQLRKRPNSVPGEES